MYWTIYIDEMEKKYDKENGTTLNQSQMFLVAGKGASGGNSSGVGTGEGAMMS